MAIRMSVRKEDWEKDPTDIEVIQYREGDKTFPMYMKTSHRGLVLELRERNGYHDSDFYAVVWNREQQKTEHIEYATTRGWTYLNGASVDATPEVLAEYQAWDKANRERARKEYEAELAKMPKLGDKVRVIAGRKLEKGTEGEVVWFGEDQYAKRSRNRYSSGWECLLPFRYYADRYRVGIRLIDGSRVFLAAKNIELIRP